MLLLCALCTGHCPEHIEGVWKWWERNPEYVLVPPLPALNIGDRGCGGFHLEVRHEWALSVLQEEQLGVSLLTQEQVLAQERKRLAE